MSGGKPRGRRRLLRTGAALGVAVLVVAAGAAAALGFGGTPESTPTRGNLPPATAQVTRQTLTETETVDGTLSYGEVTPVAARGAKGVILTWLPEEGAVISRGKPVYKVDDQSVVLLYGDLPVYQNLAPGVHGLDVKLLEQNLSVLGYGGFTVDDEYTGATADAVRQWQKDLGLDQTGAVRPDQVVVAAGPIRVAERRLRAGDLASGQVLTYTGTTRVVTVNLDVDKQQLVRKGVGATVELPDGKRVDGTVESVGTVASKQNAGGNGLGAADAPVTVEVRVSVKDQKTLGAFDEAPVDVLLRSDQREGVLTVPVNALAALAEGGYGVLVVEGSTTRYLAIKTGMFADGRVEVSGDGLTEGMTVGVPR